MGIHSVIQLDGSVSFGPNAYYVDELDLFYSKFKNDFKSISKYIKINEDDLYPNYSGIRPKFWPWKEAKFCY